MQIDSEFLDMVLRQAGQEQLMACFGHSGAGRKADGSLVTKADLACQQAVVAALAQRWPDVPCLGEEMTPEEQALRLAAAHAPLWVLDPLDGTSNFAGSFPFFCISLALIKDGQVVFGMTHDPVRQETFWAHLGGGAWLNGQRMQLQSASEVSAGATSLDHLATALAMIDHKRLPPALVETLARRPPFHSQRSLGSVALEWCWLAAGRGRLYLHGSQKLWDYAAGRLILAEAGGAACPLDATAPSLRPQRAIAAADEQLLTHWQTWLQDAEPFW